MPRKFIKLSSALVLFLAMRLYVFAQVQASFSLNLVNGTPSTVPWTLTTANPGSNGQLTVSNAGTATTGIFGVARDNLNPGTGIVSVIYSGLTYCTFDTPTVTQLNYVVAAGTAGQCHQVTSYPTSGQVIGRVVGSQLAANIFQIVLYPPEIRGGAGGGGVSCPSCTTNNIMLWNGTQLANSSVVDNGSGVTIGSPSGGAQGAGSLNATSLYSNGVLVNPSNNNIASYTGSVGINGNQVIGADKITHVNVNGYFNPVTYGADPIGAINSCAALQATIDAACAAPSPFNTNQPPTVDIPAGKYKCEQPLWDHCQSRIKGAGEFATNINSTFTGDILVAAPSDVYSLGGGTLVTSLATGSGHAFQLTGTSNGYIDLDRAMSLNVTVGPIHSGPFNGLAQFDVRGFFEIGTIATHQETLWASDGPMGPTCSTAGQCTQGLWVSTDGVLHGQLNINGTLKKINSGGTLVVGGQCYETELSYDGAHLNLYLGTNGTASCTSSPGTVTRVAQTAATGNMTQTADEQNTLFADMNTFYGTSEGGTGASLDLTTDSIQISKVARNTGASYTEDIAKFSTDGNTLFLWNFDQTPTFASNSPIAKITSPTNTFVTWVNAGLGCCGGMHEIDDLEVSGSGVSGAAIFGDAGQIGLNRVFAGDFNGGQGTLSDGILTTPNASFNSYAHDIDASQEQRYGVAMVGGITKISGYGQVGTSSGFVPLMIGGGTADSLYIAPNSNTRCGIIMSRGDTTISRLDEDAENGGTSTGICIVPDFSGSSLYSVRDSDIFGVTVAPIQIEGTGGSIGELLLSSNVISTTQVSPQVLDTSLTTAATFRGPVNLVNDVCPVGGQSNASCLDNTWSILGAGPAVPYCITDSAGSNCYSPTANLPVCSSLAINDKTTAVDAQGPCINGQPLFGGGTTSCDVYCDGTSTWRYRGSLGQFANINLNQGVIKPYAVNFVDGHIVPANQTTCHASTGNLTCNVPSGTVDNDGLLMCIAGFHSADPWTAAAGWGTAIKSSIGAASNQITCFPRVSASGEAGNPYVFTSNNGGTDISRANGIMIDYKGTNTSTLVETSGVGAGTTGTSATAPTVTTSTAGDLLATAIAICGQVTVTPAGQTTHINTPYVPDLNGINTLTGLYVGDETILLAGATGTRVATITIDGCDDFGGGSQRLDWGAANIALKPNASAGSTHNIDWSLANTQFRTLADNVTYTFSNVPTSTSQPQFLTVRTCEDATGGRTVTWPSVKWPGGSAPSMTTTASYCSVWQFEADNSVVYGTQVSDAVH